MTLAIAILLLGVFSTAALPELKVAQDSSANQSQSENPSSAPANQQDSNAQSQPKSNTTTAPPTTTSQSASQPKKRTRKKKPTSTDCAASTAPSSNQTPATTADPSSSNTAGTTAATTTAKNCPPEKVVVPQGGTGEPAIQLAGGNQGSGKRVAANKLLDDTEANLKKISAQQLSATQQEAVSQIRQFVDQSKAALTAGDVERAQTLAWKAQVLSEDLANPK